MGRRILFILMVLPSLLELAWGQSGQQIRDPRFRIVQREKWGYIDPTGKVVIPPQFDWAEDFSDGLALVKFKGRMGYIDQAGKWIIQPQFKPAQAGNFSEGVAPVRIGGKWGFIDSSGAVVIAPQYDFAAGFRSGLAVAKKNGKWGYIDHTGKVAIEFQFWGASTFTDDVAWISFPARPGKPFGSSTLIDKTGRSIITIDSAVGLVFCEGLAHVPSYLNSVEPEGDVFINKEGQIVLRFPKVGMYELVISSQWFSEAGHSLQAALSGTRPHRQIRRTGCNDRRARCNFCVVRILGGAGADPGTRGDLGLHGPKRQNRDSSRVRVRWLIQKWSGRS